MKSIRAQIFDAVVAAMKTTGIVNPKNVDFAIDGEVIDLPAISIGDRGDTAIEEDAISLRRSLELAIVYDVAVGGSTGANDAFQTLTAVIQAIVGANNQWNGLAEMTTMGDLAVEVTPHAEVRALTGMLTLSIQFTQNRYDPTKN